MMLNGFESRKGFVKPQSIRIKIHEIKFFKWFPFAILYIQTNVILLLRWIFNKNLIVLR